MASAVDGISEAFGPGLSQEVHSELSSILRLYGFTAEDLKFKWESYIFKMGRGDDTSMTMDSVLAFKKAVADQTDRDSKAKVRTAQGATAAGADARPKAGAPRKIKAEFDFMDEILPATPQGRRTIGGDRMNGSAKRKLEVPFHESPGATKTPRHLGGRSPGGQIDSSPVRPLERLSLGSTPFSKRQNPGATDLVLNEHIPAPALPLPTRHDSRIKLSTNIDPKKFAYRPMAQKLTEASEVFDDKLDEFALLVQEAYGLGPEDFGNPDMVAQGRIVAVGRVVSDSMEGRMNDKSVALECSRRLGGGCRVPLKLPPTGYSVFPGQVIAVRGTNASGKEFVIDEVLEIPKLNHAGTNAEDLRANAEKLSDGPMSIFIASGPYTTDDNLLFEGLEELCKQAAEQKPDVVILAGPFIDIEHPLVKIGDFDLDTVDTNEGGTLEDLFRERISSKLKMVTDSLVILIPSTRDAVSKHVSYPQEAFQRKGLDLPKTVKCLPNPATFSLNEVMISISTADIVFALTQSELCARPSEPDTFTRQASHLLTQRSLYPLHPAPAPNPHSSPLPLDVPYSRLSDMLAVMPDILILPSQMGAFAKVVHGVLAVNPGHLSKRGAGGTFVKCFVQGARVGEGETGKVAHGVFRRSRVEILRI